MNHLFTKKKSSLFSLRDKQSKADSVALSFIIFSNQKSRKVKNASYQNSQYEIVLETKSSFMHKLNLNIANTNKIVCLILFETKQIVLKNSLF